MPRGDAMSSVGVVCRFAREIRIKCWQPPPRLFVYSIVMLREPVLYPNSYVLYVVLAMMDIAFTWCILELGGYEANPVAAMALDRGGLAGMVLLKYVTIVLVVASCEYIGRHRPVTGHRLADWAAAVHLIPTTLAVAQIAFVTRM